MRLGKEGSSVRELKRAERNCFWKRLEYRDEVLVDKVHWNRVSPQGMEETSLCDSVAQEAHVPRPTGSCSSLCLWCCQPFKRCAGSPPTRLGHLCCVQPLQFDPYEEFVTLFDKRCSTP